jgi:hypothetical protein
VTAVNRKTRAISGVSPDAIPYAELLAAQEPVILKSAARHWPLVQRGLESSEAAMAYLSGFDGGKAITGFTGAPEIGGRFGYDEAVTALNFASDRMRLGDFLDRVRAHLDDADPPSFYVGSTDLDTYLPGLRAENGLVLDDPMFAANAPLVSIWLGNRTTAAAHYDMSNNLACCMVGRRRFTLFPPDQVANLYPGPLEPTPGGQVVTMVDFRDPDFERYPRFREALDAAQVAELEPGDVLFYPALWWHQVDALDGFNAMINYWWNTVPSFMDTPQNTLFHALLSLRDRSEAEKRGWRALFDYYIFGEPERAGAHLPEAARGALGPLAEMKARRLRAQLLNRLNR